MKAWHFVADRLRDGQTIPGDGEVLKHVGYVCICYRGLHAGTKILNCMEYMPGTTLCRVECRDVVRKEDTKLVCRERTILWRMDVQQIIKSFVCKEVLNILPQDADPVIREYLQTQNPELREAAFSEAYAEAYKAENYDFCNLWAYKAAHQAATNTQGYMSYIALQSVTHHHLQQEEPVQTNEGWAKRFLKVKAKQNRSLTAIIIAEKRRRDKNAKGRANDRDAV